jgi:hypothetical protein
MIVDCYTSFVGYLISFLNQRKGVLRAEDGGHYWQDKTYSQVRVYVERNSEYDSEDSLEHLLWKTNFGRKDTYIGVVEG